MWLLTLLLAPFVCAIINLIRQVEGQIVTLLEVLPITLIFSFVFSLPTLLIGFLVNKFIINQHISLWIQKFTNLIIAAIGLTCTLLIIKGSLMPTLIKTYIVSLCISAIALEMFNKVKYATNKQNKLSSTE